VKADLFKELYESKTDEELLSLASEKDTMVQAARDTLLEELRRRGPCQQRRPPRQKLIQDQKRKRIRPAGQALCG
jgi:hypothetical protein